jgi:hypothetical protein
LTYPIDLDPVTTAMLFVLAAAVGWFLWRLAPPGCDGGAVYSGAPFDSASARTQNTRPHAAHR